MIYKIKKKFKHIMQKTLLRALSFNLKPKINNINGGCYEIFE